MHPRVVSSRSWASGSRPRRDIRLGAVANGGYDLIAVGRVDHLDAVTARQFHALRHQIDPDHAAGPAMEGNATTHLADRPQPDTVTEPPRGTAAYSTACQAVGRTSDSYTKRSSGGPSGTLIGPN
jgi:hypothetical protein